jgi:hypothetical protein
MIVHQIPTGWQIIYHRSHALLAAEIAYQWDADKQPARIADTITAIAQHDDLEREWEGDHIGPSGAPLDFTLDTKPLNFVEPWRKLVDGALYRGRWVALLTSLHVSFLTEPVRGEDKTLDAFLDEQQRKQEAWRKQLGISKPKTDQAYAFLQWCDRLSLILCQQELPDRERWLEISPGPDGVRYDILQRADETVVVEPWPFRRDHFEVSVDAYHLQQLSFKSNDEFAQALQATPATLLRWTFAK